MQDANALGRLQAGGDLQNAVHRFADWQRPLRTHFVMQRAASDQFHGDDRRAANFLGAEDVNAVGMIDGGGQAAFAEKPLAGFK